MLKKLWIWRQHSPTRKMSFFSCQISLVSACSYVCLSRHTEGRRLRAGYTRVIMAGLSLHYMSYHPIYCTLLYGISCLLDAVDGQAARALGQTSKFGAVLDMVTDRYASIFCALITLTYISGVQPRVYFATFPQHIRTSRYSSNSLSLWISAVTICTCTGVYTSPSTRNRQSND